MRKIIVLHAGLINTETQQCVHRNGEEKKKRHLVQTLLNKAPNALRTSCDTPKRIVGSLTVTGELGKLARSHTRPAGHFLLAPCLLLTIGRVAFASPKHTALCSASPAASHRGRKSLHFRQLCADV